MHLSHLLAVRCIFSDRYTTLDAVNVGRDIMMQNRVAQNAMTAKKIMGAICGVSRGGYIQPIAVEQAEINWTDEEDEPIPMPKKLPCQHDDHWRFGKGTRNGQKLYYPTEEMFWQKWHLTDKELKEAIRQHDIFSLEMTGRIICKECAEREAKKIIFNFFLI